MRTTRIAVALLAITGLTASLLAQPDRPVIGESVRDLVERTEFDAARAVLGVAGDDAVGHRADDCTPLTWDLTIGESINDSVLTAEGNLVLCGFDGKVPAVTQYSVATDPDTLGPVYQWCTLISSMSTIERVVVDLDGFIYIAGPGEDALEVVVAKLTSNGGIIWEYTDTIPQAPVQEAVVNDLVIGPDGIPVVSTEFWVTQLNPFFPAAEWKWTGNGQLVKLAITDRGDVLRAAYEDSNPATPTLDQLVVRKISGASGFELWAPPSIEDSIGEVSPAALDLTIRLPVDGAGSAVVALSIASNLYGVGWITPSGSTTAFVTREGRFMDLAIGRDGTVYSIADGFFGRFEILIFSTPGLFETLAWPFGFDPHAFDASARIALDRRDNVYVLVPHSGHPDVGTPGFGVVAKFDPSDVIQSGLPDFWPYTTRWCFPEETPNPSPTPEPIDLLIDNGGSILALYKIDDGFGSVDTTLMKIEQEVVTPTQYSACPRLVLEDRSLWAPGTGILDFEVSFFDLPEPLENINFGYGYFFDIPVPLLDDIEFGARADVDIFTDFGAGFRTEIDGGTVDVHLPLDVTWTIPGKPIPLALTTIGVEWQVDPAARMTSCASPSFNAGLTSFIDIEVAAGARAVAFNEELFNEELFYAEYVEPNDYIFSLADAWDDVGLPDPGEWQEYELEGFDLKVRLPKLSSQDCGVMDPGGASYSFASESEDCFFSGSFSLTNALIEKIVEKRCASMGIPDDSPACELMKQIYSLDQELEISGGGGELELSLSALQLSIFCDLLAFQNLEFSVSPTATYEIRDPVSGTLLDTVGPQPLAADLVFTMPGSGTAEITPIISATSNFDNETGAKIKPGVEFNTLEVSGEAEAGGYSLFDFDECLLCFREPFFELPIPLFDNNWGIDFPHVQVDPFIVKGKSADMARYPILAGASRASLPMVIYNQTSPTQSGFNVAASGTTKILLYGDRFGLLNPLVIVQIKHQGMSVFPSTLDGAVEVLNRNTLLVEIPNWIRLLPGVARISLIGYNTDGSENYRSQSLDLPIVFPTPRLDTVNPNLWAADPAFATVPVQVIDRGTPIGTDSFITRRDYFIKMRDELWPNSNAINLDQLGPMDDLFSAFDFNQLPPFPAVLFDGLPLERYIQPVDSGIHNVRLAEQNYDRPGLVNVQLCNPGPGGGVSEIRRLDIAAPIPVVSSISPTEVEPGGELRPVQPAMDVSEPPDGVIDIPFAPGETGFRIIVRGPENVPTFDGYEEPKFGNFNASSVVRFGGIDLQTTFVSSSELQATVPEALVQEHRVVEVTVFTPDNGSFYFEELWADSDLDGVRDEEPIFQDFIASGGESPPIYFDVRYRRPVIEQLNPPSTDAGNPSFDLYDPMMTPDAPQYNFVVIGKNFRDGAVVLVDGQPRATQFVTRELLRVTLLPGDVSYVTVRRITVQNALPDETLSEPIGFSVTPPVEPGVLPRVRP